MNNITDIRQEEWFNAKPWLILGTGESLNRFTPDMIDKYNIWAIYVAIEISKYADVLHYQDTYINYYLDTPLDADYRYSAIRPINHMVSQGAYDIPTYPNAFYPKNPKHIYYDGDIQHNGVKQPDGQTFPTSNSTSFAFMFLAGSGLREIYSLGIQDGSTGVAKGLNDFYTRHFYADQKTGELDLTRENSCNQQWCYQHGTQWIKL